MQAVYVWTMAKVGTASLTNLLRGAGIPFWNAHWISGEWPESEFPTTSQEAAQQVISGNIPDTTVLSMVREPVARSISALMQQRGRYSNPGNFDELYYQLTEKFDVTYADKWFEHELLGNFGFDVYREPFPHEKGYKIYNHGRHRIFIGRLEDMDDIFEDASEELFNRRLKMIDRNAWSYRLANHPILTHYERLKGSSLPSAFLDKCYNLKYARHFYTPDELDMYKRRWLNGLNAS